MDKKCSVKARKAIKTLKNNAYQSQRDAPLVGGFEFFYQGSEASLKLGEWRVPYRNVMPSINSDLEKGNTMNTSEITRMSKIERLQTMEAIWDSLIHEKSEIESPEWHRDTLSGRKRNIKEGKAEFLSIEELRSKR